MKSDFKGIVRITYSDGSYTETTYEGYNSAIGGLEDALDHAGSLYFDDETVSDISLFLASGGHFNNNWEPKFDV